MVLSVVAVDLVGYSRKSVAGQVSLKDHFNQQLLAAIQDIPVADRIILDTGDGVAMGFLGDPEDALYVAMFMHDAMNRAGDGSRYGGVEQKSVEQKINNTGSSKAIRIGINLGPVKLAIGVGGHPNIIGDGINVADCIMGFAAPGQLTASRPIFEVMSRMSNHYADLFQYVGARTDKQGRAHDVYLVDESVAAFEQATRGIAERAAQRAAPFAIAPGRPAAHVDAALLQQEEPNAAATLFAAPMPAFGERHPALIDFLEDRKRVASTATMLAIVALLLVAILVYQRVVKIPAGDNALAVVAANSPPASTDNRVAIPLPALPPAKEEASRVMPANSQTKSPPTTASAIAPPPTVTKAAVIPVTPNASVVAEKPTGVKVDSADRPEKTAPREEITSEQRKTKPPRPPNERDKNAPVVNIPFVPSVSLPTEVPRPEPVEPTPPPAAPLDTNAYVVSRSAPAYPVEGIRQGIPSGFVKARLSIDANGNVTDVNILETKPIVAFGRETRLTLKQWKFNAGAPNRTYDIELTFKP